MSILPSKKLFRQRRTKKGRLAPKKKTSKQKFERKSQQKPATICRRHRKQQTKDDQRWRRWWEERWSRERNCKTETEKQAKNQNTGSKWLNEQHIVIVVLNMWSPSNIQKKYEVRECHPAEYICHQTFNSQCSVNQSMIVIFSWRSTTYIETINPVKQVYPGLAVLCWKKKNIEHERMQVENEETVAIATKGLIDKTPKFFNSMLP